MFALEICIQPTTYICVLDIAKENIPSHKKSISYHFLNILHFQQDTLITHSLTTTSHCTKKKTTHTKKPKSKTHNLFTAYHVKSHTIT